MIPKRLPAVPGAIGEYPNNPPEAKKMNSESCLLLVFKKILPIIDLFVKYCQAKTYSNNHSLMVPYSYELIKKNILYKLR
ncbi:MAG: hypothetical protein HW415_1400 [Deltaproteobacteria bacterium]|nr:hypothetical protein [Deltaproteobacteria bacterium]